jgi:hypothetical protein
MRPIAAWHSGKWFKELVTSFAMTDDPNTHSEEETERRREAALKRMLATPHKPHQKLSKGSPKSDG